jgi:hypothetical protein
MCVHVLWANLMLGEIWVFVYAPDCLMWLSGLNDHYQLKLLQRKVIKLTSHHLLRNGI